MGCGGRLVVLDEGEEAVAGVALERDVRVLGGVVMEEALQVLPKLRANWLQHGVRHPQAAGLARAGGVDLIEDRCPAIEFGRLGLRR